MVVFLGILSALSFVLDFAIENNFEGCELVNDYQFPLYIDSKAFMFVIGTEMDYVKEEFGERFTFNNPNQTSECGCGESFHV